MVAVLKGQSDGSFAWIDYNDGARQTLRYGGSSGGDSYAAPLIFRRALSAATAAGGSMISIANPFSRTVIIGSCWLYITTSGGANTADIGVAANGTTTSDILIDGVSLNTAGVFNNIDDKGTNGKGRQTWTATQFITGTPSATPTGLVGYFYAEILDP